MEGEVGLFLVIYGVFKFEIVFFGESFIGYVKGRGE